MKNIKIITAAIMIATLTTISCTKENVLIEGTGSILTETLHIADFSRINMEGIDDVNISYGPVQEVTVTGHANIISRIRTEVSNDTWYIELENGNYGDYELTYYLTLSTLEQVTTSGTGNVVVRDSIRQDDLAVTLFGTGSFLGFPLTSQNCSIVISGTGKCEVSVENSLDVSIDGTGIVYYKGNPSVHSDISGTGSANQVEN
ncbi:MAG: hypothetical protein GY790_06365 [Bacteroidetes bacterium]|nr:hypothetical protein [Bacteroidota bacterium]